MSTLQLVILIGGLIVFGLIAGRNLMGQSRHAARWSKSIHRVYYPRAGIRPPYWIAWTVTAAGAAYYLWLLREWLLNR